MSLSTKKSELYPEVGRQVDAAAVLPVARFGDVRLDAGLVEMRRRAVQQGEAAVKAARGRVVVVGVAQVPLAGKVGAVAGVTQNVGYGHHVEIEIALVAGRAGRKRGCVAQLVHGAQTGKVCIGAGVQHGARRRAGRCHVKAAEHQPAARQCIQVGSVNFATESGQIRKTAKIVGDDDQQIGPLSGQRRKAQKQPHKRRAQRQFHSEPPGSIGTAFSAAPAPCP